MKAALIPPFEGLHRYAAGRTYHLILSHLLTNSEYYSFALGQSIQGSYVILDNSAHEFTVGESPMTLFRNASQIIADEVVLPDRLFFGEDTVELTTEALVNYAENGGKEECRHPINFMVVPQGRTTSEWAKCLSNLLSAIDKYRGSFHDDFRLCVGLSKDYEGFNGGLFRLIEKHLRPLQLGDQFSIHLLGWGREMWELGRIAQVYGDVIRSVDSAKPFVYALEGIELHYPDQPKYPRRKGDYFKSSITPADDRLVRHNIEVFDKCAAGVLFPQTVTAVPSTTDQSSMAMGPKAS